ncbi:MAG: sulfite exporter TauE/SafE family protein [Candidatus Fermentibacteraceae bacterium]
MSSLLPLLVVFVAGALQGFCGFGYSLLAMPLLLFMMPAGTAVPMLCVTGIALNVVLLISTRKHLDLRGLTPLAIAGVVFTPVGVWLIKEVPAESAKTAIGIGVAVISTAMLLKLRVGLRKTTTGLLAAGAVSGLLNGFATFSGPPVVLLLSASGEGKDGIRSCLAAYFLLLGLIGALSYSTMGVLTPEALPSVAMALPFTVLGATAGALLARRSGGEAFRRLSLIIMGVLGLLTAMV